MAKFSATSGGFHAGCFGHADDGFVGDFAEREQGRIAEAGKGYDIRVSAMFGIGVECGMTCNGVGGARGDVLTAETAGRADDSCTVRDDTTRFGYHLVRHRHCGVRIDHENSHAGSGRSCAVTGDVTRGVTVVHPQSSISSYITGSPAL